MSDLLFQPRQDLLASVRKFAPVDASYIHTKIAPPLSVFQTAGNRPAAQFLTSGTAQTGRSAGGAITPQLDTANNPSFSVTEQLSRQTLPREQIVMFGGEAGAELQKGIKGMKEINDKLEALVVTATTGGSPTDISSGILVGLRNAVVALKSLGRVAVFGGALAWDVVRADDDVNDAMKNTGSIILPPDEVRGLGALQLAAALRCDEVWEATGFASSIWSDNLLGLCVIADPVYDPMSVPQSLRRYVYTWAQDGVNESMIVEQSADVSTRARVYDFVVQSQFQTLNSNALASVKVAAS